MEATSVNLMANMEEEEEKLGFDWFAGVILAIQILFIVFFFIFARYEPLPSGDNDVTRYWGFLRDVTIMVLVGFGYLMTFLKRHRFSAIGYTFFVSAVIVQWNILVTGFFHYVLTRGTASQATGIDIGFPELILGMFGAASVLVSFGVWIGKVGPEQLLFMGLIQTLFYSVNAYIIEGLLHVRDVGGTMVIHMFGAYFGLAAGRFISPADTRDRALYAGASYTGDTFSMIGTLFLWICWPSFNSALVPPERQFTAVINTVLALCSSTMVTFAMSRMLRRSHEFTMEDLQNATLSGGVAMGALADILISPGAALLLGSLAGALSVFGFAIVGPVLQRKLRIYDTCGVHNLHGMPAILGSVASAITASQVFVFNDPVVADFHHGSLQWGYQLASMCVTLCIAIVGGLASGWVVMMIPWIPKPVGRYLFDDAEYFELPDTFEAGVPFTAPAGTELVELRRPSETVSLSGKRRATSTNYEEVIDL